MVYSPLACGSNSPVKLLVQGSVTKHHLSSCLTTVLLPQHFLSKETQPSVVCFIQTTLLATDTGLVENLKKNTKQETFLLVKLEPPPGSLWPCTPPWQAEQGGSVALSPPSPGF